MTCYMVKDYMYRNKMFYTNFYIVCVLLFLFLNVFYSSAFFIFFIKVWICCFSCKTKNFFCLFCSCTSIHDYVHTINISTVFFRMSKLDGIPLHRLLVPGTAVLTWYIFILIQFFVVRFYCFFYSHEILNVVFVCVCVCVWEWCFSSLKTIFFSACIVT